MSVETDKLLGFVTDGTPPSLEYGNYRGPVVIDAKTGEWERNPSPDEIEAMTLGEPIYYSTEYDNLRPILDTDV